MAASAEETAALLGRVPVFEALRPEDLVRVADVAVPRSFRGGEIVSYAVGPVPTVFQSPVISMLEPTLALPIV